MGQLSKAEEMIAQGQPSRHSRKIGAACPAAMDAALAQRAAQSDCTILITGETGVGKGYLAQWIHDHSRRIDGPFVPVNCAAIPETIIDSQLFGHAKGAFSGATTDHPGLIRAAEQGTLLLDEVSELPPSAQSRLLRLLQEREVQPVGYSQPVIVDVRVVAATNVDLNDAVQEKKFREDLLFRLDVIQLGVKPLRERRSELRKLITTFNQEFARIYEQPELVFHAQAIRLMQRYPWPGNIRQLKSLIERLHVLCPRQVITADALIDIGQLTDPNQNHEDVASLKDVRIDHVKRVLEDAGGSVSRTASIFGVHRSTIYRWLRDH